MPRFALPLFCITLTRQIVLYSLYRFSKNYIHEADYEKPRASPLLYKSFNKVPPALIIMAELDMNRDHGYGRLLFTVVCH